MIDVNYTINEVDLELGDCIVEELEDFHEYLEDNHSSSKSIKDYFNYVKRFYVHSSKHFDRFDIIDLSNGEHEEERLNRIKKEMVSYIGSEATEYGLKKYLEFKKERSGVSAAKNASYIKDQIHKVGESVESRSKEDKIRERVHNEHDIKAILEESGNHTKVLDPDELELFLRVMYETAGRFSDIARLEWQDVDRTSWAGVELDDKQLFISAERSKSKNSGVVNINEATLNELEEHRDQERVDTTGDQKVFFQDRERLKKLYYRVLRPFKSAARENAVDVKGTHDLRHSRLVHIGKDMAETEGISYNHIRGRLSDYARHSDEETTEIYIGILKQKYQMDISGFGRYREAA